MPLIFKIVITSPKGTNGNYNVKKGPTIKSSNVNLGSTPDGKVTKISTSKTVNTWWKDKMGYDNPPYKPGTTVKDVKLAKDTKYVRVYDGKESGQKGGWLMKADDIEGLTPKQIQDKYALPKTPKYVSDVTVPKGTTVRTGTANGVDGWGSGGGKQYDLMGQRVGEFTNERLLP